MADRRRRAAARDIAMPCAASPLVDVGPVDDQQPRVDVRELVGRRDDDVVRCGRAR